MHMVKTTLERREVAASLGLLLPLDMAVEMEMIDLLHPSPLVTMPASPVLRTLADQLPDEIALALMVSRRTSDREIIELLKT